MYFIDDVSLFTELHLYKTVFSCYCCCCCCSYCRCCYTIPMTFAPPPAPLRVHRRRMKYGWLWNDTSFLWFYFVLKCWSYLGIMTFMSNKRLTFQVGGRRHNYALGSYGKVEFVFSKGHVWPKLGFTRGLDDPVHPPGTAGQMYNDNYNVLVQPASMRTSICLIRCQNRRATIAWWVFRLVTSDGDLAPEPVQLLSVRSGPG